MEKPMNDTVLENCFILKNNALASANIGIAKGSISGISQKQLDGKKTFDCSGLFLMPGIIDCHVHFRVPGAEHKEDWKSAGMACVSSGITTALDMPNNSPPTTTTRALDEK